MTILTLARVPLARLGRSPRSWFSIGFWLALAVAAAVVTRMGHHGAYRALGGAYGSFALPLAVFGVTGAVLGGKGLGDATRSLTAFGATARDAALAALLTAMAASAVAAALVGAIVCGVAHGPHDPPLAFDVAQSAAISGLGGAAYASLFLFGATFARGAGRSVVLGVDFILGGSGAGAFVLPRGHVRSLLGGEAVLEMSGRASTITLLVLALAFGALAVLRSRRV
ncbi:MAG: hypothetical protein JNL38_06925 [Myxococcales bacterium]|nr:hypothetical protein [Myxococcales bacterium]